jgi:glycyl-tRNA synthetase beta subunit
VDSLEVNARAIVASLVVSPESTVDEVMVMAEDQKVRKNRLGLLRKLREQFF